MRVYAKTGVAGRTELAVLVARDNAREVDS
jgi:hypothetical protein